MFIVVATALLPTVIVIVLSKRKEEKLRAVRQNSLPVIGETTRWVDDD